MYPWALAWVVLLTLVTVYEAFQLRKILSEPLQGLTRAAAAVSEGKLDVEMPRVEGEHEIADLSASVRVMRDRLVESIRSLDHRNEHMSTILANLGDGVLHVAPDGRVVEHNGQAESLLDEFVHRRVRAGVRLCDLLTALPEEGFVAGQDMQRELSFGRTGKKRYLFVRATPVRGAKRDGGSSGGHIVVVRDVTQTKEVERLKQEFLSVVTHELKTPLTAVEGYTKLMLMGKAGPLTERQTTFLETIRAQTNSLEEMIQDLLDITRLEAGRLPLTMEPVEAARILSDAFATHEGGAQTRDLKLVLDTSGLAGASIVADAFRLQQVVGNLLGNAFKFTAEGGEVELSGGQDADRVWLRVSDTGCGVPPEALPKLFDKFFQVEGSDTRQKGGAGLGLYISRELVEAQGGTIEVTSRVGVGSVFTVRFDRREAEEA